jgi:hypothetical protein
MNKILLEEDHLNGKLRFNLLNGSFTLNLRDYGAYAIATGGASRKGNAVPCCKTLVLCNLIT